MNKWLYKNTYFIVYLNLWFPKSFKIIFLCINGITLFFMYKQIIEMNIFNKYDESIIIWYGLWCYVAFQKSNMLLATQNYSWNSYNVIISHVILFFSIFFTYYSFMFCSMAHDWYSNKLWQDYVHFSVLSPYITLKLSFYD
jgi:hypothetical protein